MDDIILKILEAVIVGALGWMAGRFSIKTKQEVRNDDHEQRLQKLEKVLPLLLKVSNVQLQALKRGKVNGECDEVLAELDEYLYHK